MLPRPARLRREPGQPREPGVICSLLVWPGGCFCFLSGVEAVKLTFAHRVAWEAAFWYNDGEVYSQGVHNLGWRGSFYVLLAAVFFATLAIVAKIAYARGLAPLEVLFLEKGLATLMLFPVLQYWRPGVLRLTWSQWRQVIVLSLFGGTLASLGFFGALQYIEAGVATILLFTNPVVVLLLVRFWARETLQPLHLAALAACLMGGVLVLDVLDLGGAALPAAGIAFGLLSSAGLGFLTFYSQRVIQSGIDPLAAVAGGNLVTTVALFPFVSPGFLWDGAMDSSLWFLLLFMALFSSVIPSLLWFFGIRLIGAGRASILASFELPCNVFLAWIILREQLVPLQLVGGALVLAGVLAVQRESARHQGAPGTPVAPVTPASVPAGGSGALRGVQPGRAGR